LNQLLESAGSIVVDLDTPERLPMKRVNGAAVVQYYVSRTGPLRYLIFCKGIKPGHSFKAIR
jgi:hypothetical protein